MPDSPLTKDATDEELIARFWELLDSNVPGPVVPVLAREYAAVCVADAEARLATTEAELQRYKAAMGVVGHWAQKGDGYSVLAMTETGRVIVTLWQEVGGVGIHRASALTLLEALEQLAQEVGQ